MRFLLVCSLVLVAALSACDAVAPEADAGHARITVRLTDAPFPFDLAESTNVTITRIELLAAEADSAGADSSADRSDRVVLFDAAVDGGPFAFNLLDLRDGVSATLVDASAIPANRAYRQIRLFVGDDASVVFKDGSAYDLKLPSAQKSGIKIPLPSYSVGEDGEIDLLLDFDVERSFVTRGNPGSDGFKGFLFKPVLKVEGFEVDGEDRTDEDG